MREFKQLHSQLHDLKRVHENYAREATEKDTLIIRLKEAKNELEHALEHLTHEVQSMREHSDQLTHENAHLRSELNTTKNHVSKVEVQLENTIKQRDYLKEQVEVIAQNSAKGEKTSTDILFYQG